MPLARSTMRHLPLALALGALSYLPSAQGSLVIATEQGSWGGDHLGSPTDLIEVGQPTLSSVAYTYLGQQYDGGAEIFNNASTGMNWYWTGPKVGAELTATFNTSVNSAGYDISSIVTSSGFQDPLNRINQYYDVAYHVVGGGDTWTTLTNVAVPFIHSVPPGQDIGGTLQVTISGITATGVDQLKFTFGNDGNGLDGISMYRELDVFGTATSLTAVPEPGSLLALGCLLGTGVCLRSRRR